MNDEKVLTVDEAARELRVCAQTVYGLARAGKIQSIRLGRRVLIPRSAIDELLPKAR